MNEMQNRKNEENNAIPNLCVFCGKPLNLDDGDSFLVCKECKEIEEQIVRERRKRLLLTKRGRI